MRALVRLAHGQAPDCTRCALGEEAVRREFGCDEPALMEYEVPPRRPVFWISCDCGSKSGCERCDGGERPMYHCPRRLIEADPLGRGVERAYRMCVHYPLLPAAGGVAEQSATFLDALSVYRSEVAAVQREAEEQARQRARADEKRGVKRG